MHPHVIDALQPEGELGVEFVERLDRLCGQAQAGFKILLNRKDHPFGFSLGRGCELHSVQTNRNGSSPSRTRFIRGAADGLNSSTAGGGGANGGCVITPRIAKWPICRRPGPMWGRPTFSWSSRKVERSRERRICWSWRS